MTDLDSKLEAIVKNPLYKIVSSGRPYNRDGHAVHDVEGDVEAIKAVFKEAGYVRPDRVILTFHGTIIPQPDPRATMMDDGDGSMTQTFVATPGGEELRFKDLAMFESLSVRVDRVMEVLDENN